MKLGILSSQWVSAITVDLISRLVVQLYNFKLRRLGQEDQKFKASPGSLLRLFQNVLRSGTGKMLSG